MVSCRLVQYYFIYTIRFVFLQMSNWEKCKIYIFNCIVAKIHCQEVVLILPRIFRLYLHFSFSARSICTYIYFISIIILLSSFKSAIFENIAHAKIVCTVDFFFKMLAFRKRLASSATFPLYILFYSVKKVSLSRFNRIGKPLYRS